MMRACRDFSDEIMTDMAGNAFSAAAALATIMAAFITVPVWNVASQPCSREKCSALSPAALIALANSGETETDEESDDGFEGSIFA